MRSLAWPALALAGVVLPTQPWHGHINPAGLVLAGLAAIGWAAYILLTQKIGDRFTGIQGLSLTVPSRRSLASRRPPDISPPTSWPPQPAWPCCSRSFRMPSRCSRCAT